MHTRYRHREYGGEKSSLRLSLTRFIKMWVHRNSRDIVRFHFFVGQQHLVGLSDAAGVDKLADALRLCHVLRWGH